MSAQGDFTERFPSADWAVTTSSATGERVTGFLRRVYGWMCVGLAVTATVAFEVSTSQAIANWLLANRLTYLVLIAVELGLVFYLSARAERLAPGVAGVLFAAYAALNGVTVALVLLAYTGQSAADAFLVTAGMFGAMALVGSTTRRSLAGYGQFLFMGLIGVVLASLVGLFWHNSALEFVISIVGVVVFTGLAAWDAQRLKRMALDNQGGPGEGLAIVGALALYLDFINLFLSLLTLLGRRRD